MNNLISKQEAIDAAQEIIDTYEPRTPESSSNDMLTSGRDTAMKYEHGLIADGAEKVQKAIENLPPADPERKKGKWVRLEYDKTYAKCSGCGSNWEWALIVNCNMNFCPNCGSHNGGEQDE